MANEEAKTVEGHVELSIQDIVLSANIIDLLHNVVHLRPQKQDK